jgi:RNA polymerase sigma factor (sigma-70 family)
MADIGVPQAADGLLGRDVLEKLYYFALRKTGNRHEAEDLAQEIAMQALASVARGNRPADFNRWLWAVARNRFARWAKERRRRSGLVHDDEILSAQPDGVPSAEASLVRADEHAALRRELALLTRDYRDIVVAYYFAGERIADIAARLGVPEGTVKRRLHDCRKAIREGIEMARETGVRSFKADEVNFSASGRIFRDGAPWRLIHRLIPKNILLAAYRNPMTLEELALELGVAMPYMEEEVRLLAEGTLLREVAKGRYETDFIILDRETQLAVNRRLERLGTAFTPLLIEWLNAAMEDVCRLIGRRFERGFLLWTLIPMAVDMFARETHRLHGVPDAYTSRPDGGEWDIVGYEKCDWPYDLGSMHNGIGDESAGLFIYRFSIPGLWERADAPDEFEARVLIGAIRAGLTRDRLGRVEADTIRRLAERGWIADDPKRIVPNFPVFRREDFEAEALRKYEALPACRELVDMMGECYRELHGIIGKCCPARLAEQLKFVTGEQLWSMRVICLRHALAEGHIAIPDDPERNRIGVYMKLA